MKRVSPFKGKKHTEKCLTNEQKEKYELLQGDYPRMNWRILFQDSNEWKNINIKCKYLIQGWEK